MSELSLDHVIIAVEDLDAGAAAMSRVLGRLPSWRGRHPTYGTANVLFRLSNAYLELLAPDPQNPSDSAWTGSLGRFLSERGPGLFSVALQTSDIAATVTRAREHAIPAEDPAEGEGHDLDTGGVRRWTNSRIDPDSTRGVRSFFIQHLSPPDSLPLALPDGEEAGAVSAIVAVGGTSEDIEDARAMWGEGFGLDEMRAGPGWLYHLANASLMVSEVDIEGEPDRWAVLVCTVDDVQLLRERLGVDYEEAEYFGVPGVLVEVCGARIFITGS